MQVLQVINHVLIHWFSWNFQIIRRLVSSCDLDPCCSTISVKQLCWFNNQEMTLHIPAAFEKRLRIRPAGTTSKNCGAEALSTFRPRNATSFHLHEKCPPWRRTLGIFCFWSLLHHVLESSRANLCHLSPMQRKKIVKLPWNHQSTKSRPLDTAMAEESRVMWWWVSHSSDEMFRCSTHELWQQ